LSADKGAPTIAAMSALKKPAVWRNAESAILPLLNRVEFLPLKG
jgi:hypothetical protein